MARRAALTRAGVVAAAAAVADREGLAGTTMRSVARELGVEAMSLYHHVAGKDALLDALAEHAYARIALPDPEEPWRRAMEDRAASAREVLRRHPWALELLQSRSAPGPALLRHHEAVLATLRGQGFSAALAVHAFSALDAYVQGFVLTESTMPFEEGGAADFVEGIAAALAPYPHLREVAEAQIATGTYDYGEAEFAFGLGLLLDGLERVLAAG